LKESLIISYKGNYFRFGSVFINKNNQTKIFFFEKKTETGSNRPVSVRFGSVWFFRVKTGSNQFGSVFPVFARFSRFWLGFFRFFSVWLGFSVWIGFSGLARFFVGFGSVRFFRFLVYKTETEPAGFFKILIGLIGFFFRFDFFGFFSGFLGLIGFSVFLLTPNIL
jgi:hypothetical protein